VHRVPVLDEGIDLAQGKEKVVPASETPQHSVHLSDPVRLNSLHQGRVIVGVIGLVEDGHQVREPRPAPRSAPGLVHRVDLLLQVLPCLLRG
jgi:hypothetical protein